MVMKNRNAHCLMVLLALSLVLGLLSAPVYGESNVGVGGANPTARLNFQITIPTIMYLQVGSPMATVDTVSCTLNNIPGSGPVAMSSSGTNPVPVQVATVVPLGQVVNLTADSSTGMTGGAIPIPFSKITCAATGAFSSYTFNDGAGQVLTSFTNSGNRTGNYAFTYANADYYEATTYTGTVTYTLAFP
jgi:hypothetical protein